PCEFPRKGEGLMLRFFFCVLLLAGWGLAALCLHVVRTPGGVAIVPKDSLGITDTWADVRQWSLDDLSAHQALVSRLINTGKADALAAVKGLTEDATEDPDALKQQLREAASKPPTPIVKEAKTTKSRDTKKSKPVKLVDVAWKD